MGLMQGSARALLVHASTNDWHAPTADRQPPVFSSCGAKPRGSGATREPRPQVVPSKATRGDAGACSLPSSSVRSAARSAPLGCPPGVTAHEPARRLTRTSAPLSIRRDAQRPSAAPATLLSPSMPDLSRQDLRGAGVQREGLRERKHADFPPLTRNHRSVSTHSAPFLAVLSRVG